SYDRNGTDQLYLSISEIELGECNLVKTHPVQLLSLGIHLTGHRDAYVVVGEKLIHDGNVANQLSLTPLLFQSFNLTFGVMLFLVERLIPTGAEGRHRPSHRHSRQQDG